MKYQSWNVLWFTGSPCRMSVTAHEIFSAQSTSKGIKVKILLSDKFLRERYMLSSFLTQINTYIQFNIEMFNTEAEKIMFTAAYLYSDTLNWFELTLNKYLNNKRSQWDNLTNKIFTSFQIFEEKIKIVFKIINEKHTVKWEISLLW